MGEGVAQWEERLEEEEEEGQEKTVWSLQMLTAGRKQGLVMREEEEEVLEQEQEHKHLRQGVGGCSRM